MTSLLRRAAICAGITACVSSTLLPAQSTAVAVPVPDRTEYRRALPTGPLPGPIVQQSPNGLYKLSITDTGIELRGPKGVVTITDAGIQIGGPGTPQVKVESSEFGLKVDRDSRLQTGINMTLEAGASMLVKAPTTEVSGYGQASLTGGVIRLGCGNRPVARINDPVSVGGNSGVIAQGSPTILGC